jgi:DNA-directed RNA polymerase sigma subunit (sigma70/sigma32)
MEASCALDLADEGGHTLDEIGIALNLTRERVRQIEQIGLRELLRHAPSVGLDAEDVR